MDPNTWTVFLDIYAAPMQWLLTLPGWSGYFLLGCILTGMLAMSGWVVAKTGRSPLWALVLLAGPYLPVIAIWVFAYSRWPAMGPDRQRSGR